MKTIVLVACGANKTEGAEKAKNLYTGELFKKSRIYAERVGDAWFVLSARSHLLDPETVTIPYDQTLNKMSVSQRSLWSLTVSNQLKKVVERGDRVIFLAGLKYRESLIYPLEQSGVIVEFPLEGLGIGQQLQFLNQQNEVTN